MVIFCILCYVCLFPFSDAECTYADKTSSHQKAMERISPLFGQSFQVESPDMMYNFHIGFCTSAIPLDNKLIQDKVAVVQIKKGSTETHIVGRYNSTSVMAGTNWVLLEYLHGEKYSTKCGKEMRKATIFIICNQAINIPIIRVIEEHNNQAGSCYYLFEVEHASACGSLGADFTVGVKLSVGTIALIIFGSIMFIYLFVGFLYKRFMQKAKGFDQIPNYMLWKDFGNLVADGCEFVFRSNTKVSVQYHGLGDDQLNNMNTTEDDDRDDHLLPM